MSKLTRLLMVLSLIVSGATAMQAETPPGPGDAKRVKTVDCDRGGKISRPLRNLPQSPLEIIFTGTCTDDLVITRNDVTIRGGNEDATLVGSIYFSGSLRTTLQDFTLQVGADVENAVELQGGSSIRMENFHVSEFGFRGILVDKGAEAVLADVSAITTQEGAVIALLARGGTIFLESGLIELSGSVGGFSGTLGGRYFITGADIFAHDNGTGGFLQVNAAVIFQTGKLRLTDNGFAGLVMTSGATIHHGTVEIVTNDNGFIGMFLQSHATIVPFPFTQLTLDVSNNGPGGGVSLQTGSVFNIGVGTQTFSGNGGAFTPAIIVDSVSSFGMSGTATVTAPPDGNIQLYGNSFVSIGPNVTIEVPIVCEDTVQVLGATCDVIFDTVRTNVEDPLEKAGPMLRRLQEGLM